MLKLGWGFVWLVGLMVVVACGRVTTPPPSPVENTAIAAAATSTLSPSPTISTLITATSTPTPSSEPVAPTITPLTITTERELVFQAECPTKSDFLSSPQLFPGSILFNLGRIVDLERVDRIFKDDGIWAISAESEVPYLVTRLLNIDVKTQEVTTDTQELSLPDYAFYDGDIDKGLFYGYRSLNPHEQIILYTAQNEGATNFEVRLLDLQNGEILWRGETQHLSDTFPQWSANGSKVLFDVSDPQGWTKIISLTRDGQVEELPSQPFPFVEEGQLSGYSRSPDGRYLFYTAAETDLQTFTFKIRAFVIDIATWHVSEICDPDGSFVSSIPSRGATDDLWLPNGQFVYRIWHENDEVLWHSLHLLDIPSWTTYPLFEAEPGYGISILNWTQTELSEE